MYAGRKLIFYVNVKKASKSNSYFEKALGTTVTGLKKKRRMKAVI